jgi:hypothetical protein
MPVSVRHPDAPIGLQTNVPLNCEMYDILFFHPPSVPGTAVIFFIIYFHRVSWQKFSNLNFLRPLLYLLLTSTYLILCDPQPIVKSLSGCKDPFIIDCRVRDSYHVKWKTRNELHWGIKKSRKTYLTFYWWLFGLGRSWRGQRSGRASHPVTWLMYLTCFSNFNDEVLLVSVHQACTARGSLHSKRGITYENWHWMKQLW